MPRQKAQAKMALLVYMPPDLKQWLEEHVATLQQQGQAIDQSAYMRHLLEEDRARQKKLRGASLST